MMKKAIILIGTVASFYGLKAIAADHPCRDKVESRHSSRKELHTCLDAWAKDAKPGDVDPSDDCSSKLSTFVSNAKAVKACRVEHKEEHKK